MLSALLVTLSGAPTPAQAPRIFAGQGTPGQVREMIAPTATVVRTAHYQAELQLSCGGSRCSGLFPKPGTKRRLIVTRMNCQMVAGMPYQGGFIELRSPTGDHLLYQYLPVDLSEFGVHMLNRAVDMQVIGNQQMYVDLHGTDNTTGATCTATGTLETLQ